MSVEQMVGIFKCLLEAPHSRLSLAENTGATPKMAGRLLTEMKKQKMIYVISYSNDRDGRNRVKIYALGDGEDAQPLSAVPQEQRSRKSYLKKKAIRNPPKTKLMWSLWQ
jgi:hypothetical protein